MGTWNSRAASVLSGLCVLIALIAAGCSDSSSKADGKVADGAEDWTIPSALVCDGDCHDYVINKIIVPSAGASSQVGWDFNHDGQADNALGATLGMLSIMGGSMNVQKSVDDGINSGETLLLLRVQAPSLAAATAIKGQAWVGAAAKCCNDPTKSSECATEAKQSCFAGAFPFYPSAGSPQDARMGGKIVDSKLTLGPASLKYVLSFGSAGMLSINLKAVHVTGTLSPDGKKITNGVLSGVVMKSDLDSTLIPQTANVVNESLKDPAVDQATKDTIINVFDKNGDKQISVDEVKSNSMLQSLLAGDVDVVKADGTPGQDQVMELSMGLGFEAVFAMIKDGQRPPDAGLDQGSRDASSHDTGAADQGSRDTSSHDTSSHDTVTRHDAGADLVSGS